MNFSTQPNWSNVTAIACGEGFDLGLSNGTVLAWGNDSSNQINVPAYLTNVIAIATGTSHSLALQSNGTIVSWGDQPGGTTNVPVTLSNVVAIAAGLNHNLALQSNGIVVAWGDNVYGQCTIPPAATNGNVMAIAAGDNHSAALLNNGTVVEWGYNGQGETNVPQSNPTNPVIVKLLAAAGNHTIVGIFSPLLQYPVNVSKDLLLIYNSNSINSSTVCAYYMAHRPMVGSANCLGISCTTNEGISWSAYTSNFVAPIVTWLSNNPTLRPHYVVLFQDLPSEFTNSFGESNSVQYDMHSGYNYESLTSNYLQTWTPFVTAINMNGVGGTNDCIAYINKLTNMAGTSKTLFISAAPAYYGTANWCFDDAGTPPGYITIGLYGVNGVEANGVPSSAVTYSSTDGMHITKGTNVAGYFSWGQDGGLGQGYATNGTVTFNNASGWSSRSNCGIL